MPTKTSGQSIVSDPAICHGEPIFRTSTPAGYVLMRAGKNMSTVKSSFTGS